VSETLPSIFDHACGVATDSEGNVYVSSAGQSRIEIWQAEAKVGTIEEGLSGEESCGLGIDSQGNLYVSQRVDHEIVTYHPTEYPFDGSPVYEPPVTIDSSGEAEGISVDPFDDRLYVAKGSRIDVYGADGSLDVVDEVQEVLPISATEGGTYTLSFRGEETSPVPYGASHAEVQAALEALPTIGAGDVAVSEGNPLFGGTDHIVAFAAALGGMDVEQIGCDPAGLEGASAFCSASTVTDGFSGHIGEGKLGNATGVAAYTYATEAGEDRYIFAADSEGDVVKIFSGGDIRSLKLRKSIESVDQDGDSATPEQALGFGAAGAYLGVDRGRCPPEEHACAAGHFFVYDDSHKVLDEFEATGEYLTQIDLVEAEPAFEDAEPTAVAIDRSGGARDGTIYVTSGASTGAKVLAFAPLTAPGRALREDLSIKKLTNLRAVAIDAAGNRYLGADSTIYVQESDGDSIAVKGPTGEGNVVAPGTIINLAVDSHCNLYALDEFEAVYFSPDSCPPAPGTKYSGPIPVVVRADFDDPVQPLSALGVNPGKDQLDHVYVGNGGGQMIELGSAEEGLPIKDAHFSAGVGGATREGIAAYGANGNVYLSLSGFTSKIVVVDPTGTEVLAQVTRVGSPLGPANSPGAIAVDQANGHFVIFENGRGVVEEYEASGAFVAQFGSFDKGIRPEGIAIDNSDGPTRGNVFVAFDDPAPGTFDLTAFGPLEYAPLPIVETALASGIGGGKATLNGTVLPGSVELTECQFEYVLEGEPYASGEIVPCAESPAAIGKGSLPVAVHADVEGLEAEEHYCFRLVALNKFGEGKGEDSCFGPPQVEVKSALPVFYDEAILRARINPSGLVTKYRFEYGTSEAYGQSTASAEISPQGGPADVATPIVGLDEGTTYHFRAVVENDAGAFLGPDQVLKTLRRASTGICPNDEFRIGRSTQLPDCRAYELVTPPDTRGAEFHSTAGENAMFNSWQTVPRGEDAGERLSFTVPGTLPGFNGSGLADGYRAERGEGLHPAEGWRTELIGPSYPQAAGNTPSYRGVSPDQRYAFIGTGGPLDLEGSLDPGIYLRSPAAFEPVGQGSLGTDLNAGHWFLSESGAHVIFSSVAHLEPAAPPAGTEAIYDRPAGVASAEVISVPPTSASQETIEEFEELDAAFVGATEDGTAVLFRLGDTLYLRRVNQTTAVSEGPSAFAGISKDGSRVFYSAQGSIPGTPASLFLCDSTAGSCVDGSDPPGQVEIAPNSQFINVPAGGSRVYFTSTDMLDDQGEGTPGEHNLYLWDEATGSTRFVAVLAPDDFSGPDAFSLRNWLASVNTGEAISRGQGASPTRSTADGDVLLFQSHANLTPYDADGNSEVYRYELDTGDVLCVSCDPSGAPPVGDGTLQSFSESPVNFRTIIPNMTEEGGTVLFESDDPLAPEDANQAQDVYEWKAQKAGGCEQTAGCLALISSGQSDRDSFLYSMSANGDDVFFETLERLVGADTLGSRSIYDARVGGGLPEPLAPEPCQGDACQGGGSAPPVLPAPASMGSSASPRARVSCPKGKKRVKVRGGKHRCVKRAKHKRAKRAGGRGR